MRLQPLDPTQAEGPAKDRLDEMRRQFGGVPLTAPYLAHSTPVLDAFFGMTGATMQVLTPRLREQLALYSAEVNGCSLCRAMHGASAKRVGLTEEEIDAARRGEAADPTEDAALRLARHILETRGEVDDEVLDQVRAAGYDDTSLLEVFLAVTNNLMTNYFNRFVGLTDADLGRRAQDAA